MNTYLNQQKSLAHFIDFHDHAHASNYNTIDAIIASKNLKGDIEEIINLLQKEAFFIAYENESNDEEFLKTLAQSLSTGKMIFILTDTLHFGPIVYDQFIQIRNRNMLTAKLGNIDLSGIEIHPKTKLFLIVQANSFIDGDTLYSLTDHVLDLREGKEIHASS